jgi:sodium/potassium-transporting ATPase subunit alpha
MKINNLTTAEVFHNLVTSEQGLSGAEAARRLREFGFNELSEVKKKHPVARFLGHFTHFLAVLLWFAAALSFVSETDPGEGMPLGTYIAVTVINAVFTFVQEYAEKRLRAAEASALYIKVRRGLEISREVAPGTALCPR